MNLGFEVVQTNLGMGVEHVILIVVVIANLIWFVKGIDTGMVMEFFTCALLFMLFYNWGKETMPALVCMLIFFVLMCLSLYTSIKSRREGAIT